ncbi:MAG: SpoIIE family protein phosphatase [Spirochaetia bacterium]|jgi:serine phosphatase RsbU (regulator of sigma subunit)
MSRRFRVVQSFIGLLAFFAAAALGTAQTLYWENPRVFVPPGISSSSSMVGSSLMGLAWQEIRPRSQTDRTSGDIFLSLAVSADGITWITHPQFFGPIRYTGVTEGNEPRVYSMVMDSRDRILVAVATSDRETVIRESTDQGASFRQVARLTSRASTGVPSLFTMNGGGFLLLLSQGSSNAELASGSVTLAYSHSRDGRSWSELAPFVTAADRTGSPQLQPTHATLQGSDYVIFESLTARSDLTSSWQLYAKRSADGGAAWDPAVSLTAEKTLMGGKPIFGDDPLAFENERPRLAVLGNELGLVWERSAFGTSRPQIWSARLDAQGAIVAVPEIVAPDAPSRFAHVLQLRGQEYVLYADGSKGTSRITLARKDRTWQSQLLQNTDVVNAIFPHAVQFRNSLFIFWENQASSGGVSALVQLRPLTSVGMPLIKPVDFTPGQPANRDSVTVSWTEPQPADPSGIREYRYTWTYSDGVTTVEKERQSVSGLTPGGKDQFSTRKVDRDGTWTFSITAEDLAGNVSPAPASVSFTRDATPPRAVSFEVLAPDGSLLLTAPPAPPDRRDNHSHQIDTNSFTLRWVPAGDKDIVGYTYNVQPGWATLADYFQSRVPLLTPPPRVVTSATDLVFNNKDNGVYVLTVQALDRAGNFGPPSTIALELGHYQVVTRVDLVTTQKDPILGTVQVTILGRGFRDNGPISKIFLDRGHTKPPWDMQVDPTPPVTITDRQITGITLDENSESGAYRIGLLQQRHSGQDVLYFTQGAMFDFLSPGTVKIGNFQLLLPKWIAGPSPRYAFSFDGLLVVLIVALLGTLSVFAFRKIVALAQEGAAVRTEVVALLEGRPNAHWEERKKRMQALKRKGIGLRLKFTLLMVILVTMIVLIVSIPLGFQMVSRQRTSLATGLQSSANILLGALASSAETLFLQQEQGFFGAVGMSNLRSTMTEAVSTTISGPDHDFRPTDPKDAVWDSDEKRFADEEKAGRFSRGSETVGDQLAKSVIPALQKKIDSEGAAKLAPLIDEYRNFQGQAKNLLGKTDATSKAQLTAVNEKLAQVSKDIDSQAKDLYAASGTLEPFNPNTRLRPAYLFYKPVIFYNRAQNLADTTFYQGMIRLQVKTDTINRQIDDSINSILRTASAIALAAIALGILGAVIMASITVTPIRRLARGVAVIRDTEDKEQLREHNIEVGTRDEIGSLAETVNEMTQGLVKAAIANKELLQGIDVQKRFLPLVKEKSGGEASTAEEENARLEIYGYYKGAKGVSGDYFDFKRLDDTYYALIKCDVSGKGVSAALIMVEVATLFISHFREWPKRKENITRLKDAQARQRALRELERLDDLVYKINDMVEERGFRGKFAALTVLLYNSATGVASICNAGDTKMNIYIAEKGKMVHASLPDSPAAGSFPSMLVEMKTPYKQVQQQLVSGDVLFLQTDGFEESERKLRNTEFQEAKCDEPGLADGQDHEGTHKKGESEEDFSETRMDIVINAVFNKGQYNLVRSHNPIPNEELVFDFSNCQGTVREAVLALVSVEKVYRMVPDPQLGEASRVTIESKVADFLKEHFLQYERYFSHRVEGGEASGYATFTHAKEDEQYDDLTILVLRRK